MENVIYFSSCSSKLVVLLNEKRYDVISVGILEETYLGFLRCYFPGKDLIDFCHAEGKPIEKLFEGKNLFAEMSKKRISFLVLKDRDGNTILVTLKDGECIKIKEMCWDNYLKRFSKRNISVLKGLLRRVMNSEGEK